jgi:hypothetical protein
MSEVQNLYHVANRKGMHDVNQRVARYTERTGLCAEIIGFANSLNLREQLYTEKSDSEGTYLDFGDANIYWQNETEIAMDFLNKTVNNKKDNSYKTYLENDIFNSIGGGITPGKFNSIDGWYGSFALVQKTDIHRAICKMNFRREIIKKNTDGKETEEIIIKYNISGFNRYRVSFLAVTPTGAYRTFGAKTAVTDYNFIINDDFRSGITADEKLYIATYDSENDTYYPVMRIDLLKLIYKGKSDRVFCR